MTATAFMNEVQTVGCGGIMARWVALHALAEAAVSASSIQIIAVGVPVGRRTARQLFKTI